ncbi:hypothetical protein ABKV19_007216 [Rosa sericea]
MANGGRELAEITIPASNNIQTTLLEQRIEETKWLLHPSAGKSSCCIFRVPQCLVEINKNTYRPHIVSIGPYHHGEEHLEMMKQHKWRFLRDLLARTSPTGSRLDDYLQVVASMEEDIRGCYSETINSCSLELVEMMVLDGLFIIEFFCKVGRLSPSDPDDPIFNLAWIFPNLIQDLFRLERTKFLYWFFKHCRLIQSAKKPLSRITSSAGKAVKKFLAGIKSKTRRGSTSSVQFIQSAKKLHLAGIKFKTGEAVSFLDIRFSNEVLEIPHITLDDLRTDLFLNFVAFEQCYSHSSKHITTYAAFMSCLIHTPMDATFLCDNSIIENYLATDKEVAHFFRNMGKDVPFDIEECYLWKLFKDVNEYHRNIWHVRWAVLKKFKHERQFGEIISSFKQLDASDQQKVIESIIHITPEKNLQIHGEADEDFRLRKFTQLSRDIRTMSINALLTGNILFPGQSTDVQRKLIKQLDGDAVVRKRDRDESEEDFNLRSFTQLFCKKAVDFRHQVYFLDAAEERLLRQEKDLPHGRLLPPQDFETAAELLSSLSTFGFGLLLEKEQLDEIEEMSKEVGFGRVNNQRQPATETSEEDFIMSRFKGIRLL